MQSSVRLETPRLVTISANPSSAKIPINGGFQIDREVVVTSHVKHPGKRASYSAISPIQSSHGQIRALGQEPKRGSLNRWDHSRVADNSMRRQSTPNMGLKSADPVILDTSRDNMKALAEFLMTREPPPNNWMSTLSDDEISLRTMKKFKMFGALKKKKKKVPKTPKFMQLPDVAVAARTIQGSRHIAISIPLEYDCPALSRPSIDPIKRPKSAPKMHASEKGTVTVLKPLVEVRESNASHLNGGNSAESGRVRTITVGIPPSEILGIEATRTLEKYYRQQHQQKQQQRQSKEFKRPETSGGRASGVESVVTSNLDQRLSIGTIYSSLAGSPGHSRGMSGSSAASGVDPIAGPSSNLPTRGSSKSTFSASIEEELRVQSARIAAELAKGQQILMSSNASFKSDSSHAPTIFGTATAETASRVHSPGAQYFSRSSTFSATAAPTKKLPDLPIGADGQTIRPSTAPLSKSNSSNSRKTARRTSSVKNCTIELVEATQESRQERVKARKQRDMAAIQARVDEPSVIIPPTNHTTKTTRSSQHRSSLDSVVRMPSITMSPIMLVANLPPFTGVVLPSDLPSPPTTTRRSSSKRTSTSSTSTTKRISTPPASFQESEGLSDSDTIPHPLSKPRRSGSNSPKIHTLDARRQERRSRRNMTLHEKELDLRLSKIEKDNALLLHTLSNIASSFGQLNHLVPAQEMATAEVGMEPLMRELSGDQSGRVEIR